MHRNKTVSKPFRLGALTTPPVTDGQFEHAYLDMCRDISLHLDPFAGQGRGLKGCQAFFTKRFPALAPAETAELAAAMLRTMCA